MKDSVSISNSQLFKLFPDQESARIYFEGRIWAKGVKCPTCSSTDRITTRKGGYYRCNFCKVDFTVRTGTIFERSHVPLHKWIYAMYLLVASRKGISSLQLSKEIGITQKSAWFVLQRLREACGNDLTVLRGIIEVDEAGGGSKERNKRSKKKLRGNRGTVGKTACVGRSEQSGRISVQLASVINNDSLLAMMKRGLHGIYPHVTGKHLVGYINKFILRLNDSNAGRHALERLANFADYTIGRHITYKELTA